MSNYRVVIAYSPEKKAFVAHAPELEGCEAQGETRAEAASQLEEAMAAQLHTIEEQGAQPPAPIDEQEFTGELNLKISSALHRDLVFMARAEKMELEVLLAELLTRGVEGRSAGRARQPRGEEGRGRPREGQGQRYHDIMENRADFIEYVRSLDGGGRGGRGGGGGRPRRGR